MIVRTRSRHWPALIPLLLPSRARDMIAPAVVALTFACVGVAADSGRAEGPQHDEPCTLALVDRLYFVTPDGTFLYIEPQSAEPGPGGQTLIVGARNIAFYRNADGQWESPPHKVVGAIVGPDGDVRAVSGPIENNRLGNARASLRPDGAWDVVIAEVEESPPHTRSFNVVMMWHGVLEGDQWRSMYRLPMPGSVQLHAPQISRLIRTDRGLALTATMRNGDVALYEQLDGRWVLDVVPTRIASTADIGHDEEGISVIVAQGELGVPGIPGSLLQWRRRPEWRVKRRLLRIEEFPLDEVVILGNPMGPFMWSTYGDGIFGFEEVRALNGDLLSGEYHIIGFGPDVDIEPRIRAVQVGATRLWIYGRPDADPPTLEVSRVNAGSLHRLDAVNNPYIGQTTAVALDDSTFAILGGEYDAEEFVITSSMMRMRLRCAP
jgi:hypothetical protein